MIQVADIASRRTCPDVGLYREPVRIIVAATRDASDAGSLLKCPTYRRTAIATELGSQPSPTLVGVELKNLRGAVYEFNIFIIKVDTKTIGCTGALFASRAMTGHDIEWLIASMEAHETTQATTLVVILIWQLRNRPSSG